MGIKTGQSSVLKRLLGCAHPTTEDTLRALGYAAIMLWSVLFLFFPTPVFEEALGFSSLFVWMAVTLMGSTAAFFGAVTRIDLKMEFPGVMVLMVGPALYFVSQFYFVAVPSTGDTADRTALVVYAIIPALLLLPRAYTLFTESRRLHRINSSQKGLK